MKTKTLLLVFTILACLNFIYFGIQAVDKATAVVQADGFDDLELQDQPLTASETRLLDETYQQLMPEDEPEQTPSEIRLEIALDRILDNHPVRIVSLHHPRKYIIINISGWMTEGTDTACEMAAEIFHAITGLGLTLEVHGEFVPSRVNPMDNVWTTYLTSGDGGAGNNTDIHL